MRTIKGFPSTRELIRDRETVVDFDQWLEETRTISESHFPDLESRNPDLLDELDQPLRFASDVIDCVADSDTDFDVICFHMESSLSPADRGILRRVEWNDFRIPGYNDRRSVVLMAILRFADGWPKLAADLRAAQNYFDKPMVWWTVEIAVDRLLNRNRGSEQAGGGQPATRSESK
jgi:hypothetical protein